MTTFEIGISRSNYMAGAYLNDVLGKSPPKKSPDKKFRGDKTSGKKLDKRGELIKIK